jgi:hypothetical protein
MAKVSLEDLGDGNHEDGSRAKVFSPEATVIDPDTNKLTVEGAGRRTFEYKGNLIASKNNRSKGSPVSCEYGGVHHSGYATTILRPAGQDPIATCDMHAKHHLSKVDPSTFSEKLTDHEDYKVERANLQDEGLFRTENWVHQHVGNDFPITTRNKETRGPGAPTGSREGILNSTTVVPSKSHIRAAHNAVEFAVDNGDHTGPNFEAYLHHAMTIGGLTVPEAKSALIHGVRSYEKQQGIMSVVPRTRNKVADVAAQAAADSGPTDQRDAIFRESAGMMEDIGTSTGRESKRSQGPAPD